MQLTRDVKVRTALPPLRYPGGRSFPGCGRKYTVHLGRPGTDRWADPQPMGGIADQFRYARGAAGGR
jgi:hypothetical protein